MRFMTPLADAMLFLFVTAWCVAVIAHLYATRFFLPLWATGFRKTKKHKGYKRKAIIGYSIFILAIGVGFAAGGIAEYWGGGW